MKTPRPTRGFAAPTASRLRLWIVTGLVFALAPPEPAVHAQSALAGVPLLASPQDVPADLGAVLDAPVAIGPEAVADLALPDAPSLQQSSTAGHDTPQQAASQRLSGTLPRCEGMSWRWREPQSADASRRPCRQDDPLQSIVSTGYVAPLTPKQKGELAARELVSPFNLLTVFGYSAIYVAAESHSPYGPGFKGFGRLSGYSLLEDTQGQFFGTFLVPTLAQEDPRYHRMPDRPVERRILHALAHTVLSQHDDGTLMPNYAVLVTYPVSALLSDAYVPGIGTSPSDTTKRIVLGYATNPAGDLIAEFLPDIAKHVHVRVVFVQQIVNQLAANKSR
jgi:hypothetical protein